MGHPVTLIHGDGIGPEVAEAARLAIDATGVAIDWHQVDAGTSTVEQHGASEAVLTSIRKTKVALKGPTVTPPGTETQSIDVALRKQLNLYANLRPAKSIPGIPSAFKDVDLIVVRENTEGLYAGIEFERTTREAAEAREFLGRLSGKPIREDSSLAVKTISVLGSQQIVDFAFRHATVTGRKKVTAVHKANRMKSTDGLFLEIAREVAKDYPNLEFEDCVADILCMQLMQKPERYDVLVMPNLFGDILSDLCTGMVGGLGITPSVNIGHEYAVFEAVHGAALHDAGQNRANPGGLILSGVLMLQHLGEIEAAAKLQEALESVIAAGQYVTYDLAPVGVTPVGTMEMAEAIAQALH
ncbi:MAG: isocitrate/isopropylmalate family dehydrogenase [Thermosynechococcaceae cyanobacterium MS004]|nr:isocitrate/isopropylmalate family dehydrogenase [Thermosynechococcaceae cyanobacterium MS004]